jgi:hypothetical protein
MDDTRDLFRSLDSMEPPDRWSDVERLSVRHVAPSRSRRAARKLATLAATAAVTGGLLVLLSIAFGPAPSDRATNPEDGPTELSAEGTSLMLPEGWFGRADALPGYTRRLFQIATFAPSPPSDIEAPDSVAAVGRGEVLILLHEVTWTCPPCPTKSDGVPVAVTPEDLTDPHEVPHPLPTMEQLPPGASLARHMFTVGPRYFDLAIVFGAAPTEGDFDRVNQVLGSLVVEKWEPEPDGACHWDTMGMLDPDCREPHWLREVLDRAGFTTRQPGGTFVARKNGVEFFIWVEPEDEVSNAYLNLLDDPAAFPIRTEVNGVVVYGNDSQWTWFANGVHVQIGDGPYGDSVFPSIDDLRPLIAASSEVPFDA